MTKTTQVTRLHTTGITFTKWMVHVYLLFCLVCAPSYSLRTGRGVKQCPHRSHMKYREKSLCNTPDNVYMCLQDSYLGDFIEICSEDYRIQRPGHKVVWSGNIDGTKCETNRFQSYTFNTSQGSSCYFRKSYCNGEGQVMASVGSSTDDTTCRCDHTRGYAFVNEPLNQCYCIDTVEDCSCYVRKCLDSYFLSPDYTCVKEEVFESKYVCQLYDQRISEDNNKVSYGKPTYDVPYDKEYDGSARNLLTVNIMMILMFLFAICLLTAQHVLLEKQKMSLFPKNQMFGKTGACDIVKSESETPRTSHTKTEIECVPVENTRRKADKKQPMNSTNVITSTPNMILQKLNLNRKKNTRVTINADVHHKASSIDRDSTPSDSNAEWNLVKRKKRKWSLQLRGKQENLDDGENHTQTNSLPVMTGLLNDISNTYLNVRKKSKTGQNTNVKQETTMIDEGNANTKENTEDELNVGEKLFSLKIMLDEETQTEANHFCSMQDTINIKKNRGDVIDKAYSPGKKHDAETQTEAANEIVVVNVNIKEIWDKKSEKQIGAEIIIDAAGDDTQKSKGIKTGEKTSDIAERIRKGKQSVEKLNSRKELSPNYYMYIKTNNISTVNDKRTCDLDLQKKSVFLEDIQHELEKAFITAIGKTTHRNTTPAATRQGNCTILNIIKHI